MSCVLQTSVMEEDESWQDVRPGRSLDGDNNDSAMDVKEYSVDDFLDSLMGPESKQQTPAAAAPAQDTKDEGARAGRPVKLSPAAQRSLESLWAEAAPAPAASSRNAFHSGKHDL
jgi:hypothetical protein